MSIWVFRFILLLSVTFKFDQHSHAQWVVTSALRAFFEHSKVVTFTLEIGRLLHLSKKNLDYST